MMQATEETQEEKEQKYQDVREHLTPSALKAYMEPVRNIAGAVTEIVTARSGHAKYNKGSILVVSKHPLDECVKRGILEDFHRDIGKRIKNYRDCFESVRGGRLYNGVGEGDDSVDAGTVYAVFLRRMEPMHYRRIKEICFAEPDIDGNYLTQKDYDYLFPLALNYQASFEIADKVIFEARKEVKARPKKEGE